MRIVKFAVTLVLLASFQPIFAQSNWEVVKTFPIGGQGAWDYLTVDSQTHRLFVPRSTHTMVIDGESGKVLGDIPGQKIAHGVALVPRLGRGFISDGGGDGGIVVFDLKSYGVGYHRRKARRRWHHLRPQHGSGPGGFGRQGSLNVF